MELSLVLLVLCALALHTVCSEEQGKRPIARSYGSAVPWDNDTLVTFFGEGETGLKNDTWLFSFLTHEWMEVNMTDVPSNRKDSCVVKYNGYIYAYGGYNDEVCINDLWMLDPIAEQWILLLNNNTFPLSDTHFGGRCGHVCAIIDDCMYIFGGYNDYYSHDYDSTVTDDDEDDRDDGDDDSGNVEEYTWYSEPIVWDLLEGTMQNVETDFIGITPNPRRGWAVSVTNDSLLLVHGGQTVQTGLYEQDYWLVSFNRSNGFISSWHREELSDGLPPLAFHSLLRLSYLGSNTNFFLVFGGQNDEGEDGAQFISSELLLWDMNARVATTVEADFDVSNPADIYIPNRSAHQAVIADSSMYIWGGVGYYSDYIRDMWIYDAQTNVWTRIDNPPDFEVFEFPEDSMWWLWFLALPLIGTMIWYTRKRTLQEKEDGYVNVPDVGVLH